MSAWQSDFIEANGMRLHYTRTGGDKPPVVLAHGFSDDGLCWTPVSEILAANYDVIMVDARGHGRSTGPEQGYGQDDHAADLAGLIKGLGLHRPSILGHSMGAVTALALAGLYPGIPGSILLEDPPAWWTPDAPVVRSAEWEARRRAHLVELKRKTREELIVHKHAESPGWSEAELGPWADSKLRLSFNVLNRAGAPALDWRTIVQQITCPVLLIRADPERGAIVTTESAADLQSLLSQVHVVHLSGAGHNIRREQFAPYMEAVQGFLIETAV